MKVAILGFGTVGTSVARILCEHPQGVTLSCIFNRGIDRKRVPWIPSSVLWTENFEEVLASNPDIVVELAGGLHPAGAWVRRSLAAGKSVVTANKKMIAEHGPALEELARRHGCQLLYGAAVAGGVPVIPAVQQGLAGDRIIRLHGILNGTCNFILSNMENGAEFDSALREAQERGYAEANPTEDVDGFDARAKLVILSRIGLRMEVLPEEVDCRTIRDVSAIDFAYAHGAGGNPTAVAVLSDVLAIAHGGCPVTITSSRARVDGDLTVPHYIRFIVDDRPGIVAEIAGDLAGQHININALLQKPGYPKDRLPFVVTVEPCRSSALKAALAKIARLDCMQAPPFDLQMLEEQLS